MNPHTATLAECRDFLAECKGWMAYTPCFDDPLAHGWLKYPNLHEPDHPIPATLDAIAGALPDGWVWECIGQKEAGGWFASCSLGFDDPEMYADADTERLARIRVACLAWMEHKKESPCSPR